MSETLTADRIFTFIETVAWLSLNDFYWFQPFTYSIELCDARNMGTPVCSYNRSHSDDVQVLFYWESSLLSNRYFIFRLEEWSEF